MAGPPLVVMSGPPGCGKGTQCARLVREHGFGHISAGDVLREEIEHGTTIGRHVSAWVDNGHLVPDAVVIDLVLERLDDQLGAPAALLDGFPRTVAQAEALEHRRPGAVALVIALAAPRATITRRLELRNRDDDHDHALACRIVAFERETRPMLSWFAERGLLVEVDGDRPVEAVSESVAEQLAGAGIDVAGPR